MVYSTEIRIRKAGDKRCLGKRAAGKILAYKGDGSLAKILVVEDDVALAKVVKEVLLRHQHVVDVVNSGDEGFDWLKEFGYTIAIVDWELPSLTGVDLCKRYRAGGGKVPILMLTGRGASADMVTGLDAGADDYLSKPFEMNVLLARVRSLLRRTGEARDTVLRAGDIELDPASGMVRVGDIAVDLGRKELGVLEHLMRNPNRIHSSESLIKNVWSSETETSAESVRCVVNRLRTKLQKAGAKEGAAIKAVYGMGYKMEL
jgi:DNA-binding response OmpR family regulator